MKTPRIVNAVGHIDDDLVSGANRAKVVNNSELSILTQDYFIVCPLGQPLAVR